MTIQRLDHVNFITHDVPATIDFYCHVIGLESGKHLSIDTAQSVYLYIPGQKIAILHIGHAKKPKIQPKFERFADLDENNNGQFSTGSFDHFCLALDEEDYAGYIERFENMGIAYQTYCHDDFPLKQIWVLDPNGIRVELNFL